MKKIIFALLVGSMSVTSAYATGISGLKDRLKNIAKETVNDEMQSNSSGIGGLKDRLKNITREVAGGEPRSDDQSTVAVGVNTLIGLVQQESVEEEIALGQEMTAVILGASKLHPNKGIQNYVNLVGRHIANQSERAGLPWTFGVLNASTVNAFAAPGGYVLISKGLYDLLETEDELAAVLGHEIAHVVNKHHLDVLKKQSVVELGVRAAGDKGSKQLAQLATSMSGKMLARGLDKSAEYQADRDGIVLAARAGYDASAMLKVLDNLELHGQRDRTVLSHMLLTHPAPGAREVELARAVNQDVEAAAVLSPAATRISRYRK